MNILVTGGTGGVGKAVVELLAADSNNLVYFTYRGSEEKAQEIISNYKNTVHSSVTRPVPKAYVNYAMLLARGILMHW